ncbi:MAG: hypothetical protein ACOYYI_13755 [Chloroflexota bacterium]
MNEKRMKDALEAIARRGVPEDVNLMPSLAARLERRTLMTTLRARPVLTLVLVLLTLALLTGAAYAIGKMTGYIPGVGLVDQSAPIRILTDKPSVQREGITLTMKQVIVDSNKTRVMYHVKGISMQDASAQECMKAPSLLAENGVRFESTGGYVDNVGGENGILRFDADFTFPSLPDDLTKVTLVSPCDLPLLTLRLIPAPEGLVLPATEIAPTFKSSRPLLPTLASASPETLLPTQSYPTEFPATLTPVPNGSGLYLEKVVELADSYLLIGNFTDTGDLPGSLWNGSAQTSIPYEFRVTDRHGERVSFSFRPDLMPPSVWSNVTPWALEVRKPLDAPITITLPEISLTSDDPFQFRVDVGTNPAVGQTWSLNRTVEAGGYSFTVKSLTRAKRGYTLTLRSPVSREQAFFDWRLEEGNAKLLSERVYDRDGYTDLTETLIFENELPTGVLTFTLHIYVDHPIGPWTLVWSPPDSP